MRNMVDPSRGPTAATAPATVSGEQPSSATGFETGKARRAGESHRCESGDLPSRKLKHPSVGREET